MIDLARRVAFVLVWPFVAAVLLVVVAAALLVAWFVVPTTDWPRKP